MESKKITFQEMKKSVDSLINLEWNKFKEKLIKLHKLSPSKVYEVTHKISFIATFDYDLKEERTDKELKKWLEESEVENYKKLRSEIKKTAQNLTYGDIITKGSIAKTENTEITNKELEEYLNNIKIPKYIINLISEDEKEELKIAYRTSKSEELDLEVLDKIKPFYEFLKNDGISKISQYLEKKKGKKINMRGFNDNDNDKAMSFFLEWKKPDELTEFTEIKTTTINLESYIKILNKKEFNGKEEIIECLKNLEPDESLLEKIKRKPLKKQIKNKFDEIKEYNETKDNANKKVAEIKKRIKEKYSKSKELYEVKIYMELYNAYLSIKEGMKIKTIPEQIEKTLGKETIYSIDEIITKGQALEKQGINGLIAKGYEQVTENNSVTRKEIIIGEPPSGTEGINVPTNLLTMIINNHNYQTQAVNNPEIIRLKEYETLKKIMSTGKEESENRLLTQEEINNLKAYDESIKNLNEEEKTIIKKWVSIESFNEYKIKKITRTKATTNKEKIKKKWLEYYLKKRINNCLLTKKLAVNK